MKTLRVLRSFMDKYTAEVYQAGTCVDFEDSRAYELLRNPAGLVEIVESEPEQKPKPKRRTKKG